MIMSPPSPPSTSPSAPPPETSDANSSTSNALDQSSPATTPSPPLNRRRHSFHSSPTTETEPLPEPLNLDLESLSIQDKPPADDDEPQSEANQPPQLIQLPFIQTAYTGAAFVPVDDFYGTAYSGSFGATAPVEVGAYGPGATWGKGNVLQGHKTGQELVVGAPGPQRLGLDGMPYPPYAPRTGPPGTGERRYGKTKFFNAQKGFGFILDSRPEELAGDEGAPCIGTTASHASDAQSQSHPGSPPQNRQMNVNSRGGRPRGSNNMPNERNSRGGAGMMFRGEGNGAGFGSNMSQGPPGMFYSQMMGQQPFGSPPYGSPPYPLPHPGAQSYLPSPPTHQPQLYHQAQYSYPTPPYPSPSSPASPDSPYRPLPSSAFFTPSSQYPGGPQGPQGGGGYYNPPLIYDQRMGSISSQGDFFGGPEDAWGLSQHQMPQPVGGAMANPYDLTQEQLMGGGGTLYFEGGKGEWRGDKGELGGEQPVEG
ncbi:hypothetical protein P7C70_g5338, partial [Phenoliferia sp. Uapishka_3]